MTSYTELLILYDLILIAIVGTYMAGNVLRKWTVQIRASRGGQAVGDVVSDVVDKVDKGVEKAKKAQAKVAKKAQKAQEKLDALQNKIRSGTADALGAAEDAVRPEED